MQRRYLSNPVFFLNDQRCCSSRNDGIHPENNKTPPSIVPFNEALHQKVFTVSFNTQKASREKRGKLSIY